MCIRLSSFFFFQGRKTFSLTFLVDHLPLSDVLLLAFSISALYALAFTGHQGLSKLVKSQCLANITPIPNHTVTLNTSQ